MRQRLAPWLAVLTLTAAGAAAAAGYGLTAPKRYRATAEILVAPVSPSDPTFAGIGVLRDTGGKRTAAASVAALLRSPQVADAAAAELGSKRSGGSLLDALDVHVVDSSDVVAVRAEDTSAGGAAQLANTFANVLVAQRTAAFHGELAAATRRDRALLAAMPAAERSAATGQAIAGRLATLGGLEGQQDPTVRVAAQATAPGSASSPRVLRLVGLGAGIGAAAGILAALVLLVLRRPGAPAAAEPRAALSEGELDQLGDRLEARLVKREAALAARERDLRTKIDELRELHAQAVEASTAAEELARRERLLADRIETAAKREAELARRAAEVALREREPPPPPPPPEPPEPAADGVPGAYNLVALERLVDDRGAAFPERLEEWTSYLYFLREYAGPDGAVPATFDWLIQETFAELLPEASFG